MLNAQLEVSATSTFFTSSHVINDRGSGAKMDMSLWTPNLSKLNPPGHGGQNWSYLGLFPTNNYNDPPSPPGPLFLVRSLVIDGPGGKPPLMAPTAFAEMWECRHNNRPSNLGIYSPVAPFGYIAIGSIAVMDFNNPPKVSEYPNLMCVRQDLCVKVTLTQNNLIWNDHGSGAPQDVSVFMLPNSNTCIAVAGYPTTYDTYDIRVP